MKSEHGGSKARLLCLLSLAVLLSLPRPAFAQPAGGAVEDSANPLQIPDLTSVVPSAQTREGVSATLKILVLMTVLTLAPAIIMMTTCFVRIIVVLGLMRQAMGTPQLPPGQVLTGLTLFLTMMIMWPTWSRIQAEAITPYMDNEPGMTQRLAFETALQHMRGFMYRQIERAGNEEDVYLFLEYGRQAPIPLTQQVRLADVPTHVLIPAFMLSELKIAFVMGFRIYLPFLVIDMVIASILISMGMLMLPPVLISLPFKVLMFVLADGWHLVVGSLLESFVP